jgi:hypothetical protein
MMSTKARNIFQTKSILMVRFISEFCSLEKMIINMFKQNILKVEHSLKNKLYFYYGVHVGHNVVYDFERNCVMLASKNRYDEEEMFGSLNLNKIIQFERRETLINSFKFNIDSEVRKTTSFPLFDCCLKLIKMRNKLAHEVDNLSFSEKEIIEILPIDYLRKYNYIYLEEFDMENADEDIIALLSNIVYMKIIMNKLNEVL